MKFQFQNGTIKSYEPSNVAKESPKFQFQNGTIKSHIRVGVKKLYDRFNSKMVRLKVFLLFSVLN